METTLPPLQAEEASSDQKLQQQDQIRSSEEAFRTLLSRATASIVFLASSLIVYYTLPFYPPAMSVFLAIVAGAVAYRWPAVALSIMLLFAAPAYSYQLGVTLWALSVPITIALVLPLGVSKLPGAALGSAVGAAAGALMLTPYFWLSLPLLAAVTMLRLKGSTAGGGWGLFMFLTFYLPFLFLIDTPVALGETAPLFLQVDYPQPSALSSLDLDSLKTAFQGQLDNDVSGAPRFSQYFYEGFGGVALVLIMFMAVVVTPAMLNLSRRIEETRIMLRGLAPLLSLLAIGVVFLVPIKLLEGPLGYHTGFDSWENIAILTGIMLALGIVGFIVEIWLGGRNLKVELRGALAILSLELYDLLGNAKRRLQQVGSACRNKDLGDEKAAIAQYEERVALTLESVGAMGPPRLELSRNEFANMTSQLSNLLLQLETKLFDNLDESRGIYRTTVDEALALGIPTLQGIILTLPPSSEEQDFDEAILEQERLNRAFQELASALVSAGDVLVSTIKDEIDPEFSLTTIEIGHGFLDQGRFEEAAQTISEDLQIIDGRIEHSIVELAGRVTTMANNFREVMASRLIPVFELTGESDSLDKYYGTVDELEAIAKSVRGSRTLADMISIVEQSRKLADLATSVVGELKQKINNIEAANDQRCPARYSWGKNNHAASDVQQLLKSIESLSSESTISSRFSTIEKAVQAVEQLAKIINQYSQISEFLINYPNIEYMLHESLTTNAEVVGSELPVKPRYALEYLKLYAANNYDEVTFDPKSGTIKYSSGKRTGEDETWK